MPATGLVSWSSCCSVTTALPIKDRIAMEEKNICPLRDLYHGPPAVFTDWEKVFRAILICLRFVDQVKRDILNLYEDDFMTIDPTGRISMLFDAIPAQLNKNAARYQASSVLGGANPDVLFVTYYEVPSSFSDAYTGKKEVIL